VTFRSQAGETVERVLIRPEEQPTGTESYQGDKCPAGEWMVMNRKSTVRVVNRFPAEQVLRCSVSWTAKGPHRVTFSLWSPKTRLEPGQTLVLASDYGT
jgi:hypothetical protein